MTNQQEPTNFISSIVKAYTSFSVFFWLINIFSFIIIFFVISPEIASFGLKVFCFLFCIIVGGFFGALWSLKRDGTMLWWTRFGINFLLLFFTLLAWANNTPSYSNVDCSNNTAEYNDGYSHGKIISHASDKRKVDCLDYIELMKKQGIYLNGTDCFCSGYYDGKSNINNKYK